MNQTLQHALRASAMLMKKAADGLPQKRFHQIILSLVMVLALMPATNVQADTILTQSETYSEGMTQVFTYNGYSYQVTYTNLKGITTVYLGFSTLNRICLFVKTNASTTNADFFYNNANTIGVPITMDDLPLTVGKSSSFYYGGTIFVSNTNKISVTFKRVNLVNFNSNGGSGSMDAMVYDDATAKNLTKNSFTHTGYTFSGWATTATGSKSYDDEASYTATSNVTLYAKWTANQYTVTLDDQSATTAGQGSVTATYDTTMPKLSALPTKAGYTFGGYFSGTNGSGTKYYNADGTSATTWNIAAATTLYAQWLKNPIVTLNYNDGSATVNQTIVYGKTFAQPTDPIRTGYTFGGWYASSRFAGSAFDFSTSVTSDMTLYAKWTAIQYNITYSLDGGTNASNNPTTYNVESNITLSAPTKTGYTFTGWTGTDLSTATANVTIAQGSTGDRTYTANWTITIYKITFNANGGSDVASQNLTYGEKVTQPAQQTRTGYTFGGWYSDNAFANAYDFTNSTVSKDLTLYAKWTPYTYTIKFHSNNGTDNTTTQTIKYGEETALTNNTFTNSGYGFVKWTTAVDGTGTSYTDGQKILNLSSTDGDVINLYAQWKTGVNYIDVTVTDGKVATSTALCKDYTAVTSSTTTMNDGWYVVNSNETVSGAITVSGTVNLILCDGYTLTVTDGIRCDDGKTLNIYGQSNNTGTLKTTGSSDGQPGIGTMYERACGAITINGGTVIAQGAGEGTGIGSASKGYITSITINGGIVTATGGEDCAGIGSGYYRLKGTITINGGTVTATGGSLGAGIGASASSNDGTIIINSGTVTATGGSQAAGIGVGPLSMVDNIIINGGTVTATGGSYGAGIGGGFYGSARSITINGGTITANSDVTGIGNGKKYTRTNASLVITGGNIKATTNVTPTNGTTYGSQPLNCITQTSLEDAVSLTAKETAYTYNLTDVKAIDGNYYIWLPLFEVTWKNSDGSILKDEYQDYGSTISYDGTPTLDEEGLTYTFNGWSPALAEGTTVTGNVTYTATYNVALSLPTQTINGATYYEISKREDWDAFSTAVNIISPSTNGIMTADVNLGTDQTMTGTSSIPYTGIFNGNGKTLTVNYINNASKCTAPFKYVNGSTIQNLKVSGTIATNQKYASGFIGQTEGSTNILNCHSDVTINSTVSGGGTHGGLVGNLSEGTTTVNNCLFTGAINGSSTSRCGGFVGWRDGTLKVSNSLNACTYTVSSYEGATFSRNGGIFTNSYYVNGNGTAQGRQKTTDEIAATATMASLLQGSQTDEEYWIADPTQTAYPMLKCFATAAQVTKSDDLAATYYNSTAWTIPSGMKVYTVNSATSSSAIATEYTGTVVPAGTAVVISGAAGDYQLNFDRTSAATSVSDNLLRGSDLKATTTGDDASKTYSFYKLSLDANETAGSLGFYYGATGGAAFTNIGHKAYLPISSQEGSAKGYILSFDDEPTSISSLPDNTTENGAWYTISGIRLSKKPTTGGLYIHNGKKVIIK